MTSEEKELLVRFLQQLTGAQARQKDNEAEALIRDACARQPDAQYLLVQRAMQLDYALQAAQAQVQKLQSEFDQARTGSRTGFLNDPNAWGSQPSAPPARSVSGQPLTAVPAPAPAAPAAAAAAARPPATPWGGGGMLGTVATTAAGVVAGSFLFQGIQGLMHRNDPPASSAHAENTDHSTPPTDESHIADNSDYDSGDDLASGFDDSGSDVA